MCLLAFYRATGILTPAVGDGVGFDEGDPVGMGGLVRGLEGLPVGLEVVGCKTK